MIIRIIFGIFSSALAGGFWYVASSFANYMNPNYTNSTIFPITFFLVLTLAIFTNSIARVWGWGILLSSLACFYMPIATFIGASKGAVAMVENSQPGMDQAASAVGATIGTGLVTALTGFVGFFLGAFLLIISYFLLRTSRAELIEIQKGTADAGANDTVVNRIPSSIRYGLISLLSIGMLVSSFSTIISSSTKINNQTKTIDESEKVAEASIPGATKDLKNSQEISRLLDAENLGKQIDFLENKFTIKPSSIKDRSRIYEISGCNVNLQLDKNMNVYSIEVLVTSNKCVFDTPYGKSDTTKIDKIISGDISNNLTSRILVNCINSCGHTEDPKYLYFLPATSAKNIDTSISFVNVDGRSGWIDDIISMTNSEIKNDADKIETIDDDDLINCTEKFDRSAMRNLKGGEINSYSISVYGSKYTYGFPNSCRPQ